MPQHWSRRQVLRGLSGLGIAVVRPCMAWAQSQDAMVQPALDMLAIFTTAQRRQAVYAFEARERRDWHYIPRRRPGVPLSDLTPAQQERLWALLHAALSARGIQKTRGVIAIEAILGELSGRPDYRDPGKYAIVFFGTPSAIQPWGWRFEGHHLSLTFTVVPGQGVAATPAFLGAHPATVPAQHAQAGVQILQTEKEAGFRLLHSLAETQKATALMASESLGDILSGPGREAHLQQRTGLALGAMTDAQRQQALALIEAYIGNVRADMAQTALHKATAAGIETIHFAWAGSHTPERPHYYRLHGPTLLIEYDNTQNGANHVHSVWHDPMNSFGQDLLRAHYERHHAPTRSGDGPG
ncbi:MAG: DUF3500 domain-containing protein [Candidatus Tectimicrobiota bacterium]